MDGKNIVILIGMVGQDPELREFGEGKKVANFSLATNKSYKPANGERKTETQWHRIKAWGKDAEFIGNYIKKGDMVCVEGEIQYGKYTSKEGVEKYTTDIVVNKVQSLSSKRKEDGASDAPAQAKAADSNSGAKAYMGGEPVTETVSVSGADIQNSDDDLPF